MYTKISSIKIYDFDGNAVGSSDKVTVSNDPHDSNPSV